MCIQLVCVLYRQVATKTGTYIKRLLLPTFRKMQGKSKTFSGFRNTLQISFVFSFFLIIYYELVIVAFAVELFPHGSVPSIFGCGLDSVPVFIWTKHVCYAIIKLPVSLFTLIQHLGVRGYILRRTGYSNPSES